MAAPSPGTITAANSVYSLVITGLFPVPQILQGYAADAAFDTDASEPAEVVIGVDGGISAGYVPFLTRQTISIMPDSPSSLLFESWLAAQKAAVEIYYATATISLPSVNRSYVCSNGVLTSYVSIPGTRRVLQARNAVITWGSIDPVPVAL
nr:hypothetical protein [uncultured Lichenicoccus sp.]